MEAILKDVTKQKDAIELANEIERMESALKLMKVSLKKYVELNGPVNTGEKIWDIHETVSWQFKDNGLLELSKKMVSNKVNPWDYINITPANLKKVVEQLNMTEEELGEVSTKKRGTRFRGVKAN